MRYFSAALHGILLEAGNVNPCQGKWLLVLQIFGFDILLDITLKAWLIEVNTGPDLSSSSPLDKQLKHKMVAQMMHLVGVVPYDRSGHARVPACLPAGHIC